MPAIHETAYPYLKRQPSANELARIYTPTRAERDLAARATRPHAERARSAPGAHHLRYGIHHRAAA
jgi:hypothetical protein